MENSSIPGNSLFANTEQVKIQEEPHSLLTRKASEEDDQIKCIPLSYLEQANLEGWKIHEARNKLHNKVGENLEENSKKPIKFQDVTQLNYEKIIQESAQSVPQILVAGDADDNQAFKNIQTAWNNAGQNKNYKKSILQHLTTSFRERKYFGIDPNNQRHRNRLSTFLRNRLESNDFGNREILQEGLSQLTQGSDEEFEQGKLFSSSSTRVRRRSVSEPPKMSLKEESLTVQQLRATDLPPLTKEEISTINRISKLKFQNAGKEFLNTLNEIDLFRTQAPATRQAVESFISKGERLYGKDLMQCAMLDICSGKEAVVTLDQVKAILAKADTVIENVSTFLNTYTYIPKDMRQDIALSKEMELVLDSAEEAYRNLGPQEQNFINLALHSADAVAHSETFAFAAAGVGITLFQLGMLFTVSALDAAHLRGIAAVGVDVFVFGGTATFWALMYPLSVSLASHLLSRVREDRYNAAVTNFQTDIQTIRMAPENARVAAQLRNKIDIINQIQKTRGEKYLTPGTDFASCVIDRIKKINPQDDDKLTVDEAMKVSDSLFEELEFLRKTSEKQQKP